MVHNIYIYIHTHTTSSIYYARMGMIFHGEIVLTRKRKKQKERNIGTKSKSWLLLSLHLKLIVQPL